MRALRADARRNLERILVAARDVIVEQGPSAPLDDVARRAGVGIGTLYRRFPTRQALLRGVAADVLQRVANEAQQALADEPEPFMALERYMHRALDLRVAAVMPSVVGLISPDDHEIRALTDASAAVIQRIIDAAQSNGSLRRDVGFGDIGMLLVRLSRPLPGPFPRDLDDALAHRHLDLVLGGLRAVSGAELSGPVLTRQQLRAAASKSQS